MYYVIHFKKLSNKGVSKYFPQMKQQSITTSDFGKRAIKRTQRAKKGEAGDCIYKFILKNN